MDNHNNLVTFPGSEQLFSDNIAGVQDSQQSKTRTQLWYKVYDLANLEVSHFLLAYMWGTYVSPDISMLLELPVMGIPIGNNTTVT